MAHLPFVGGIGEVKIGLWRICDIRFVIKNDPCALAEAKPLVVGVLQVRGDPCLKRGTVDGLQHTDRFGPLQPRGVDGQQDIRR